MTEKRTHTLRRQFNQSFCDEHGNVMVAKVIAVGGQIMVLYYTARYFSEMISRWDTLLICLSFIIAPDLVRKIVNLKYGNGHTAK